MQPIYFGSTNMSKLYAGGTEIVQVYYNGTALLATGNPANMAFVGQTANLIGSPRIIEINNGVLYVAGSFGSSSKIDTFYDGNLTFIANAANNTSLSDVVSLGINNGFIYAAGTENTRIFRLFENNLVFNGNSVAATGIGFNAITINNGFIYTASGNFVRKYHESNLAFVGNTATYNAIIRSIATNNGKIYAGGNQLTGTNRGASVYHESNLVRIGNTVNTSNIANLIVANGYLYVATGGVDTKIRRFYAENRVFLDNTPTISDPPVRQAFNNGYLYVGDDQGVIYKYAESNLSSIITSINTGVSVEIDSLVINNGYVYALADFGLNTSMVKKYYEQGE